MTVVASPPSALILSSQQERAKQEILGFLNSNTPAFLLAGYAGTGKTTLLQAIAFELRTRGDKRKIAFSAPTNKAVRVLAKRVEQWGLGVDALTCAQLFAIRPQIDNETGKEMFVPDRERTARVGSYDLIVVDESSMVSEELWKLFLLEMGGEIAQLQIPLDGVAGKSEPQFLFVGDRAQLPPINEIESQVFSIPNRIELTEVLRFGGSIGEATERLRDRLNERSPIQFRTDCTPNKSQGIFKLSKEQWESNLLKAFQSPKYAADPNYCRAIAWRNRRVGDLSQHIRSALFGAGTARFVVGDRLVADRPCLDGEAVILPNSAECIVTDVRVRQQEVKLYDPFTDEFEVYFFSAWDLEVLDEDDRLLHLWPLHEDSKKQFAAVLDALAQSRRWQMFWQLKGSFHELSYAYALTVHKSQGSTFENVFVAVPDLTSNRKIRERNQLLYVAMTRASQRIFLY